MRNIFLEKSYKKCDGETCPRSSSKKTKLSTSLDQHAKVLQFAFTVCPSQGLLTYILKLRCRSLVFYLIKKLFLKKKQQRFGQDTLPHFLYDSWKNIFLTLYSINWPNFTFWLPLLFEMLGTVYCNSLFSRFWRHKFWN